MKIYTKTGDKGNTSLCGGEKASKASLRVSAYGDIDELSSHIGLAASYVEDGDIKDYLVSFQKDLLVLGSYVASCTSAVFEKLPEFGMEKVERLERAIDKYEEELEPITSFILPGGTKASSAVHVARTVCRRCERSCVRLSEKEELFETAIPYLNRLSDLLFVLARVLTKFS